MHTIINHHDHSPHTGDHHRAKKERASQRVVFRSVLATVADGEELEETLRLDDAKVRACVCLCAVYAFLYMRFYEWKLLSLLFCLSSSETFFIILLAFRMQCVRQFYFGILSLIAY